MQRIGVLYNPLSDRSRRLSGEVATWLRGQDVKVWHGTSEEGRVQLAVFQDMDLLIILGGDGTVLRGAHLAIPHQVPLLTVALGRLNFMAELTVNGIPDAVRTLRSGGGWYEERTLIDAVLNRGGQEIGKYTALNEVVLSRSDVGRVITIEVELDDIPLTTYRADGVLVATATGSTAYALSAGGPIVDPRANLMVLVPIAAHLTAIPSMVLHKDSVVKLHNTHYHQACLSIDGRESTPLKEYDIVTVSRSRQVCTFARVQPPNELYASFVQRLRRQ